jgi:hypothetical protein
VLAVFGGVVGLLIIVGWYALQTQLLPRVEETSQATMSMNNIRQLVLFHLDRSIRKGWPKLTGKSFVLSPVATGAIDPYDPYGLSMFFSPADGVRSLARVEPGRWRKLTKETLRAGGDVDALTSYVGPAVRVGTAATEDGRVPLIADLYFEDFVIVGFVDGSVRSLTREDLGLAPGDEWVIGPEAKSDLLRLLSYE